MWLAGLIALAFGSRESPPDLPAQSLCPSGGTTSEWLSEGLAAGGPQAVADALVLRAPTTVCVSEDEVLQGRLEWVLFESLEIGSEGQTVRRHRLLERGESPRYSPRAVQRQFRFPDHALRITLALDP